MTRQPLQVTSSPEMKRSVELLEGLARRLSNWPQPAEPKAEWAFRGVLLGAIGLVGVLGGMVWNTLSSGQETIIQRLDVVTTRLGTLDVQMSSAKGDIGNNTGKIDMLQGAFRTARVDTNELMKDVAVLKQQVTELKAGRR